jgi:hypothetical protein
VRGRPSPPSRSLARPANDRHHTIEVGQTVEIGKLRIHRYADHFELTDLTNAGIRGRKVRRVTVGRGYDDPPRSWDGYIRAFLDMGSLSKIERFLKEMEHDYPGSISVRTIELRAIDVLPKGRLAKDLLLDHVEVRVSAREFAIFDRRGDEAGRPANVTSAIKFSKWFDPKKMKTWPFHKLTSAMMDAGIEVDTWARD